MTAEERAKLRTAAWLAPSLIHVGGLDRPLRPLSLGTLVLSERIGLALDWSGMDGDQLGEAAVRYLWSHGAPLDDVLWHVHAGTWEDEVSWVDFQTDVDEHAPALARYLAAAMQQAEAAWVDLRPRRNGGSSEAPGGEAPPSDLVAPDYRVAILTAASRALPGVSETGLLWEMPLARLLAYHHAWQWHREEVWTCAPTDNAPADVAASVAAVEAVRAMASPGKAGRVEDALGRLEGMLPR